MTVFLRALYGPFARKRRHPGSQSAEIYWHFFGIREDNTMGRWAVVFTVQTRKWKTVNFPMTGSADKPVVHSDAFVPDKPMVYGPTYLAVLKPRLSEEDIAFASRAAIEAARQ